VTPSKDVTHITVIHDINVCHS